MPSEVRDARSPEQLMVAVARGDEAAFEQVHERFVRPVFGLVLRVVRDHARSEEVTQKVLVEVWRSAMRFDPARGSATARRTRVDDALT